jgi:hypothetical protein
MGALPSQFISWRHQHLSADTEGAGSHRPQFLYALRDTEEGDRQVVWEGGGSQRGIVAVVDFGGQKLRVNHRWRAWGVTTLLEKPISPKQLRSDPVLARRFSRCGLQGLSKRLTRREAAALDGLAGGLPEQRFPARAPGAGEPVEDWFGTIELDPEKTFELAVHTSPSLWRTIGFPSAPLIQQRLPGVGGKGLLIPDLLVPGVVGEVKRSLAPGNGPDQTERYLRRAARLYPEHGPWLGILIHGEEHLSAAGRRPLGSERCINRGVGRRPWPCGPVDGDPAIRAPQPRRVVGSRTVASTRTPHSVQPSA